MSIEAMNWAYQQAVGNPNRKAILVALSNQADQDGKCWPSMDYLEARTEISRSTIIRQLGELEKSGFIAREHRGGDGAGRKSNVYYLALNEGLSVTMTHRAKCHHDTSKVSKKGGLSVTMTPKQSITIIEQSIEEAAHAPPPAARSKRGTRIPEGWEPTDELRAWAEKERPDLAITTTVDSFRDYWAAKAGRDATKLDWTATFRNWVRNEKRKPSSNGSGRTNGENAYEYNQRLFRQAEARLRASVGQGASEN